MKVLLVAVALALSVSGLPYADPPLYSSSNGVLKTTFNVVKTSFPFANWTMTAWQINGNYTPPTLSLQPGDRLELTLNNQLTNNMTNLHFHGLQVNPNFPGDDSFLQLLPGGSVVYNFTIPKDHPAGLYWYHSHVMLSAELQVFQGLSGAMIIGNILSPVATVANINSHVFLLKELFYEADSGEITTSSSEANDFIYDTVNGLFNPTLSVTPNELQLWRFAAVSPDRYWNVTANGGLTFSLLAVDGVAQNAVSAPVTWFMVPPAGRFEVFFKAPASGTFQVVAEAINTGPEGEDFMTTNLFMVNVTGTSTNSLAIPSSGFGNTIDYSKYPIAASRIFLLEEDTNNFYINRKIYDPNRNDTIVDWGTVEYWTIINNSTELHAFHIHITHFQVDTIAGVKQVPQWTDTVNIPFVQGNVTASSVGLYMPFLRDGIVGRFVYHCHVLEHEDGGMMASIVVRNSTVPAVVSNTLTTAGTTAATPTGGATATGAATGTATGAATAAATGTATVPGTGVVTKSGAVSVSVSLALFFAVLLF